MTSSLDDLNEAELEASLLWTDDEGGDADIIIDPDDEEFLLNDTIAIPTAQALKEAIGCCQKTDKEPVREVIQTDYLKSDNYEKNNFSISNLVEDPESVQDLHETTITDEFINLDVTFDTRDALETSLSSENSLTELEETKCDSEGVQSGGNSAISEEPKDIPYCDVIESDREKDSVVDQEKCLQVPQDLPAKINFDSKHDKHLTLSSQDVLCLSQLGNVGSPQVIPAEQQIYEASKEEGKSGICDEKENGSPKDTFINPGSVVSVTPSQAENGESSSCTVSSAIKSIRHAVAKRAKSLSCEQEPETKRARSASEPLLLLPVEREESSSELVHPVLPTEATTDENHYNAASASKTPVPSINGTKEPQASSPPLKKKIIVSFNYKNYSKENSSSPFVCKTCGLKIDEELKFESHLIANHAMSLVVKDFKIDLHQHYKQKKDKLLSQSKNFLPRLTVQDTGGDQSILADYKSNIKFISKGPHYLCEICENIYSSKNLVIGHLKSPKHIMKKSLTTA